MDALYHQFESMLAKKVLVTAEALARQMQARHPKDERSHVAMARVAAAAGKRPQAIGILEALYPLENTLPLVQAYLASFYIEDDRLEDAEKLARVSLELAEEPIAMRSLGMALCGLEQNQEGSLWLSRSLTLQPQDSGAWVGLARAYRALGRPGPAAQSLEHAVALEPRNVDLRVEMIRSCAEASEVDLGRQHLTEALTIFPRHPELLKVANTIRVMGTATNNALAEEISVVRALADDGDVEGARLRLDKLFKLHRPTRAMKFVRAEMDAIGAGAEISRHVVDAMQLMKDYPEAWEPRALLAELLLRKGRMRNVRQAGTHADEAWTMSGGNPRVGVLLIRTLRAAGKGGLADALGNQLRALGPYVSRLVDRAAAG